MHQHDESVTKTADRPAPVGGRSADPAGAYQAAAAGHADAAGLLSLQALGGNGAVGRLLSLFTSADPGVADPNDVRPIVGARPATPASPLDDPKFNPTTRAHDLHRAVDSKEHTLEFKAGGVEDVEAERRKIDFPVVLAALDDLTASQVPVVEEAYFQVYKTRLRDDLFGAGQSGRKSNLTPDQRARLEVLMLGTKAEPIPPGVMADLRRMPPDLAGQLKADLESKAEAGPALRRREADAIELHELLSKELNETRLERVMTLHRRDVAEIDSIDKLYNQRYGDGAIATDLGRRFEGGLQRIRLAELRAGDVAKADACAIEAKRRRIEKLNEQDELMGRMSLSGIGYDPLKYMRAKERQELTAGIQSILEVNKQEALTDPANAGRNSGEAVAERLGKILNVQGGEAGTTLGSELTRTLGKEDAAVIAAMTDPWNAGTAKLVRAAAAQLAADERAGTTSAAKIVATLRSFRELARRDLMAKAADPAVPAEQKRAMLAEGENGVTALAVRYIREYREEYTALAGGKGRSYDEIVESADNADENLIGNLSSGGGQTADVVELEHAMAKENIDAVKTILKRQPNREKIDELIAAYNARGERRDLRKALFGSTFGGVTATAEQAQIGHPMMVSGGLVTGRDAAQVAEQLAKPTAAELAGTGSAAEAKWMTAGGLTEYEVTMAHRGLTGWAREFGDVPETQQLLERTRADLAALGKRVEAERDPAKRAHLLAEIRRLRATLTGDADAYEQDNKRVLGEIQSALSFAVSLALAVIIPGAGAGFAALLQTTAVNIAATVASNFVIKMGDYGLADLKSDILGGLLGAGGAKLGEELMGVAAALVKPAGEATAEAAGKLGVQTVLSKEVGSLAAAAPKTALEIGAREVGGFFGGIYGPKVLTGDFGLTVDELLKALATTGVGKIAHRGPKGTTEDTPPRPGDEPPTRPGEEPAQQPGDEPRRPHEETGAPAPADGPALQPAAGAFHPEPVPANADVFGPRSPREMLLDNGIPPASADGFQQVADVFDIVIKVRPTNTASLPVLEAGGVPKPELIKAKTVNRVDLLIGGPADGVGKVGFFEPTMPSQQILEVLAPDARRAVEQRHAERLAEWREHKTEYEGLAAEGLLRIKDGVLQIADLRTEATPDAPKGQFKDIGGDHDLYEITKSDGTPLPHEVRRRIVNQLRSMGINVEHADHVNWEPDKPGSFNPAMAAKIRTQHETREPLVAFVPKSQPREVMANDSVTGPARTDRHRPASKAEVIEPTTPHEPVGPSDETDFSVDPRHATAEEIANARAPAPREPSPMMPRVRETRQGTPISESSHRMAMELLKVRDVWPNLSDPHKRAELMMLAINTQLAKTGVPLPTIQAIEGNNSFFNPKDWTIGIGHPALVEDTVSTKDFAIVANHVRHELEHAVQEFRIARRAHVHGESATDLAKRLAIKEDVAAEAITANANPGAYETIANTPLDAQTAHINESVRGLKAAWHKQIRDRIEAADDALADAETAASRTGATQDDIRALKEAKRIYNEAHKEYMQLPDEALAWDAGEQVQIAIHIHHDLPDQIARAERALDERQATLDRALSQSGAKRAIKKLRESVEKAQRNLDALLDLQSGKPQK